MKPKQTKTKRQRQETEYIVKETFNGKKKLSEILAELICTEYLRKTKEEQIKKNA